MGTFLREVFMFDIRNQTLQRLPDLNHTIPIHLCFLQDYLVAVLYDGQVNYYSKRGDFTFARSCAIHALVTDVVAVHFGSTQLKRDVNGKLVTWSEAVCLAHIGHIVILDEHANILCKVPVCEGARINCFQAISESRFHEGSWHTRNELVVLFEDPVTLKRRVQIVKMTAGFESVQSQTEYPQIPAMGQLWNARGDTSVIMFRYRIAIVSHEHCIPNRDHHCVLRVMDLKEGTVFSTAEKAKKLESDFFDSDSDWEDAGSESELESESESELESESEIRTESDSTDEEETEGGGKGSKKGASKDGCKPMEYQKRGKRISLKDFFGGKDACVPLSMDHARIVFRVGPSTFRVVYLK
ncbi:hypothetical protein BGZ94_006956 [Podila epigama]|nr:hypothetical protein BGZ94_006956 [Podila epigama]